MTDPTPAEVERARVLAGSCYRASGIVCFAEDADEHEDNWCPECTLTIAIAKLSAAAREAAEHPALDMSPNEHPAYRRGFEGQGG